MVRQHDTISGHLAYHPARTGRLDQRSARRDYTGVRKLLKDVIDGCENCKKQG